LSSKFVDIHASHGVPVFIKAKEIILNENPDSIEHIVNVIEELALYEKEIRNTMKLVFESTYTDVLSSLIEPVDKYFEEEYEK
jgi:hypothetical protein